MKMRYFWAFGTTAVLTTAAFAADPVVDPNATAKKTVASQYYVDTLKQNKLGPTDTGDKAPITGQSISLTEDPGVVGKLYLAGGGATALTKKNKAPTIIEFVNGSVTAASFATNSGVNTTDVQNAIVSLQLLHDVYAELSGMAANTLSWNTPETTATQGYSVTFSNSVVGAWPAGDSGKLVTGNSLAQGLALKQNKMTCNGWDTTDPNQQNDAHCWLWQIN